MTTIEKLIHTIEQLKDIAEQAIELSYMYSGNESETADELSELLEGVMKDHHNDD